MPKCFTKWLEILNLEHIFLRLTSSVDTHGLQAERGKSETQTHILIGLVLFCLGFVGNMEENNILPLWCSVPYLQTQYYLIHFQLYSAICSLGFMRVGFKTLFLPSARHKGGEWNCVHGVDSMEELCFYCALLDNPHTQTHTVRISNPDKQLNTSDAK